MSTSKKRNMKMIKLLEEVAGQRQLRGDDNMTIQLSSTFIKKVIDDVNYIKHIEGKEYIMFNDNMIEFKLMLLNKEYTIKNRAYRDNTNDEDVEKVIVKFIYNLNLFIV